MKVRVNGLEFGYDRAGSGEPVLLVPGLATPRLSWVNQMPVLARHFDVTCFDNRGIGESEVPGDWWSMPEMVSDTLGIMDAVGYTNAHLVGVSMGGIISQAIAMQHPERVRSLTLISTYCGGPDRAFMDEDVAARLFVDGEPAARIRAGAEATFGRTYRERNPDLFEGFVAFALANPPRSLSVFSQLGGCASWLAEDSSGEGLSSMRKPALVLHGDADEMSPVRNAEMIADRIPDAKLRVWADAGHALIHERSDEVNEAILEHLLSVEARALS
ncbi:MAG TPA: alpha/beta hydrolase [Actinomycetota bacterium]|nr:alpha/beta hydrolase [Actinomycetota bacterium]